MGSSPVTQSSGSFSAFAVTSRSSAMTRTYLRSGRRARRTGRRARAHHGRLVPMLHGMHEPSRVCTSCPTLCTSSPCTPADGLLTAGRTSRATDPARPGPAYAERVPGPSTAPPGRPVAAHPYLDGGHPRAYAHRGWHIGELAGLENTTTAFHRAVDEGFGYLELDV